MLSVLPLNMLRRRNPTGFYIHILSRVVLEFHQALYWLNTVRWPCSQLRLAPLGCSLAYLPVYLLDDLTILFSMVVKSLKPLLEPFFKIVLLFGIRTDLLCRYCFHVLISISSIGTTFLHLYRSPVSVPFFRIMIYDSDIYYAYYLSCYRLTPDSCMLLFVTCPVWYHLSPAPGTWLPDL